MVHFARLIHEQLLASCDHHFPYGPYSDDPIYNLPVISSTNYAHNFNVRGICSAYVDGDNQNPF
jgi:hypothetical protein